MDDVTALLRAGLLDDRAVVVAGPGRPQLEAALAALGGQVTALDVAARDEAAAEAAARARGPVDALVVDAAALFAGGVGADGELAPLRAAADGAWIATRAVANAAWIEPGVAGGKVVLAAPRPGDGPHAGAARAALENLARTLSIEWARHGIRTTAITPGDATSDAEVAALAAYLVSPAGDYFSGARLDLGAARR